MSEWRELRIGDAVQVKHGFAFPGSDFGVDSTSPQVLTPGNFAVGGGFQDSKPKSFRGDYPPEYLLNHSETVITMTDLSKEGDTLGYAAHLPAGRAFLHNQRIGLIKITDPAQLDRRYFEYLTRTGAYRDYILGTASGSTVRHTSPARIEAFVAVVPPLPEQQAIAEVLGALDDKSAANTALAMTAEKLLRTEIDSEWLLRTERQAVLSDFVDLNPRVKKPDDSQPPYIDMKKLPESGWSIGSPERREAKSGTRFQRGDTLLARITPCLENRKTGYVDNIKAGETAIGSTEFIVLRAKNHLASPIAFLLATETRFREFAIQNMVGTSGRQRVNASDLARFELPKPDEDWLSDFGHRSDAIFTQVASVQAENLTLAATRDALLPQLMSGKLRVRDAEKLASAAGA